MYLEQGHSICETWLTSLLSPTLEASHHDLRVNYCNGGRDGQHPPSLPELHSPIGYTQTGQLAYFNEYVQQEGQTIDWQCEEQIGLQRGDKTWTARAVVQHTVLGVGQGRTKQLAKHDAATKALQQINSVSLYHLGCSFVLLSCFAQR